MTDPRSQLARKWSLGEPAMNYLRNCISVMSICLFLSACSTEREVANYEARATLEANRQLIRGVRPALSIDGSPGAISQRLALGALAGAMHAAETVLKMSPDEDLRAKLIIQRAVLSHMMVEAVKMIGNDDVMNIDRLNDLLIHGAAIYRPQGRPVQSEEPVGSANPTPPVGVLSQNPTSHP